MPVFLLRSVKFAFTSVTVAAALTVAACGGGAVSLSPERSVSSLRLIGQQILPRRVAFGGTVVGGLSGIDYDAATQRYVLISDDRTTTDSPNAPRMYFADLAFDAASFTGVTLTSMFAMRQPDGNVYPKVPDLLAADPESVRFDPVSGNLLWVSEGQRTVVVATATTPASTILIDPFVREITPLGTHVRQYAAPAMFKMSATETGPRNNLVFEGLTVTPDRSKTVVITENALFQDGPTPTLTSGATSRITVYDRASGVATAQFAYPLEKIQQAPVPEGQFSVNGATEILAVTDSKFLVLERSFSVGVAGNQVRLYEIDVSNATNVLNIASLTDANATRVSKRLVLNFDTLKTQLGGIANLEGITFGPKLANGHDSLVVVADDNFPAAASTTDFNQFLVFEVLP